MLRLIGASLLTLFGIALARYLAERERRRVTVAEAYLDFLRYIRGELHAFARPLGEVYRRAENPVLEENGFLPALRAGETPGDAARRTSPPTDPALVKLLSDFGAGIWRRRSPAVTSISSASTRMQRVCARRHRRASASVGRSPSRARRSSCYCCCRRIPMDISLILKVAGVGILVTVACQILTRAGRDEQATLVSITGIVIVLLMLVGQIGDLFRTVREVFGL